ncbi:3-oxoacyl-[acyl-carrier-protein] reductase FabG [Clostridiales bacterium]|nr:3-oxoacyl-[acyl-carrier-protein] reductase FabG [Clostridiales bacterium]
MKNAVITGSSRGIGKAIAEEFAKNGYHVILNASNSVGELNATLEEFSSRGYSCEAVLADVSDYEQCLKLFKNEPSVVINNAGIAYIGLFSDMTPEQWKRIIDVNLLSVFNCTHIALKTMVPRHSGTIINISSVWGKCGASCEAVYSASKGGINSFTEAMAKEVGPSGIRVNAISCGVIDTEMNACFDEKEKSALCEEIPLSRFGTAEEVAKLAVFLSNESTAGYINGQIIGLDGGL